MKKKRLLEMAKKGKKNAKKQLTKEELIKIKEMLEAEIKEVFNGEYDGMSKFEELDKDKGHGDDEYVDFERKSKTVKGMTF